ncbi:electron transport complex subunit E [Nitrogeniibacter mangrovi]|uniref:Ion-translocating oxidoreductase complex subunit E n=1 Tax=Nitrogeniibacter mangrovi TaxID=2016596 RepID=A0A6C1B9W5_9RHOO|nr:electron transport complex subunit E [Nitrogeniibacter mangrovi]QID19478.1 electron transport complex subunit E [Nitrogeniibacter mangrovi]
MSTGYSRILREGVWDNNVVMAQMLALCPTMAVTTSGTNGLGMGLASTAVLVVSNVLVSMIRNFVSTEVRIPVFIVLIATLVTLVDMVMNAWLHDLYKVLGLFIALIVVNCAILGRAEAFAARAGVLPSLVDGLAIGLGMTGAMTAIGLVREFLGAGTLFAQASNLLGPAFGFLEVKVPGYGGALLMILPPGAFAVLGFMLAGKRLIDARLDARAARVAPAEPADAATA